MPRVTYFYKFLVLFCFELLGFETLGQIGPRAVGAKVKGPLANKVTFLLARQIRANVWLHMPFFLFINYYTFTHTSFKLAETCTRFSYCFCSVDGSPLGCRVWIWTWVCHEEGQHTLIFGNICATPHQKICQLVSTYSQCFQILPKMLMFLTYFKFQHFYFKIFFLLSMFLHF